MEELGGVEKVIPEEKDFSLTYSQIKEELVKTLEELSSLPMEELLQKRYERFRKY